MAHRASLMAILTEDAPSKSKELVEKRGGKTAGAGFEALTLNAAAFADPEATGGYVPEADTDGVGEERALP